MRSALISLLIGACAAFGAVGCGDDDKDEGGSDKPAISKAQFAAKADAICKAADAEVQSASSEAFADPASPTEEELAEFSTETLVPNFQKQADDIRALGAPEGDEDTVAAMLSSLEEGIELIKNDPSILGEQEQPAPFKAANEKAEELGLKVCGQS
jgi:hypothetical protein